jgi:hypothetical protein
VVTIICEYADDSELFWIVEDIDPALSKHSLWSPIRASPLCNDLNTKRIGFYEYHILNGSRRRFIDVSDAGQSLHTFSFLPDRYELVESITPFVTYIQLLGAIAVDGEPNLILGLSRDHGKLVLLLFNSISGGTCTLPFPPPHDSMIVRFHAARMDIITGSILIAGSNFSDGVFVWRHICGQKAIELLQMVRPPFLNLVQLGMEVFLAKTFFGCLSADGKRMHLSTYNGTILPSYDDSTTICDTPITVGDTMYFLRLTDDLRSFWCMYQPLTGNTSHGPWREDAPKMFCRSQLAGRFLVEHYATEKLIIVTHLRALHQYRLINIP